MTAIPASWPQVTWSTWARYHLVPILNKKSVAELNAPADYCPWCEMAVRGERCPHCEGPLVKKP